MLNKVNTNIERIIAKIDNDFNPDNSDWIPRVGAWCIDAMGLMNAIPKEKQKKILKVNNRIAYSECPLDKYNLKVYDSNGCTIKSMSSNRCCNDVPSTGGSTQEVPLTPNTVNIVINNDESHYDYNMQADTVQTKDYPNRYNVVEQRSYKNNNRNYVIVNDNKIELNFDADEICIEQDMVITEKSNTYGCELPVIPNNSYVIEALVYYCMYKMLCRGYKHPVFNLHASQYGTNPKYEFEQLRNKAERSLINTQQGDINDIDLWWSAFYLQTFKR